MDETKAHRSRELAEAVGDLPNWHRNDHADRGADSAVVRNRLSTAQEENFLQGRRHWSHRLDWDPVRNDDPAPEGQSIAAHRHER